MADATRDFLGGFENEGIRPWGRRLQHAVLAVIHLCVFRDFTEIPAQQGEMMFLVDAADAAQTLDSSLIIEMTDQCVTGVCGQGDDAAAIDDLRSLLDQSSLWIVW